MVQDSRVKRALALIATLGLVVSACSSANPTPTPAPTGTPAPTSAPTGTPAATPTTAPTGTPVATPTSAGTSPTPTAVVTPSPTAEVTPPPSGEPIQHGGTLSVAFAGDFQHLDPAVQYDFEGTVAALLNFESPLDYDDHLATLVPKLATEMPTISADGLTYTVHLRSGVNFINNDGSILREMTGDDMVYSLNRVLDPNLKPAPSPVASAFFGNIVGAKDVIKGRAATASGIKLIDPMTVEIDLIVADDTFDNILGSTFAAIVPKELATEDTKAFDKAPVGTGMYYFSHYTKGQKAVYLANTHYWQPDKPYLDGVDFDIVSDTNAELQQVEAGTIDLMGDQIPTDSFTAVTTGPFKDQVVHDTISAIQYLAMDTASADGFQTSNLGVRQAIEQSIDKDFILQIIHGTGTKADCIFPTVLPGYDANCHPYTQDPDLTKQAEKDMLTAAGFPNGFDTDLYIASGSDTTTKIAQAIQADLGVIGINVNIKSEAPDVWLNDIETPGTAPMSLSGWYMDYPDQSDFIDPILSCASAVDGGSNAAWYCDPAVDALAATARGEVDLTQRTTDYQTIQSTIMAAAPWVPLYYPQWYTLQDTRVQDFFIHPVWDYDLRQLWLKPAS